MLPTVLAQIQGYCAMRVRVSARHPKFAAFTETCFNYKKQAFNISHLYSSACIKSVCLWIEVC